jgi:hypothetical protein
LAGFSTRAEARSKYDAPVSPIEMLRVSYAVGSGLALASAGVSMLMKSKAAASRRVIESLQSARGIAAD